MQQKPEIHPEWPVKQEFDKYQSSLALFAIYLKVKNVNYSKVY